MITLFLTKANLYILVFSEKGEKNNFCPSVTVKEYALNKVFLNSWYMSANRKNKEHKQPCLILFLTG